MYQTSPYVYVYNAYFTVQTFYLAHFDPVVHEITVVLLLVRANCVEGFVMVALMLICLTLRPNVWPPD